MMAKSHEQYQRNRSEIFIAQIEVLNEISHPIMHTFRKIIRQRTLRSGRAGSGWIIVLNNSASKKGS